MPYKDPVKAKECQQKYYQKHKEEIIKKVAQWVKDNPDKRKKNWEKFNHKPSTGVYKARWHEIKAYNGNQTKVSGECKLCGTTNNLVIHHRDGCNGKHGKTLNNQPENLVILCKSCHPSVHSRWGLKEV